MEQSIINSDLPICSNLACCNAYDKQRICVEGVYTLYDPFPSKKARADVGPLVRIVVEDNKGPLLEAYWHLSVVRSEKEIKKFDGTRVRVTGVYYKQQPHNPVDPAHTTAMVGPCISPVEKIELVLNANLFSSD